MLLVKRRLFIITALLFFSVKLCLLQAQACVDDYFYADINTLTVQEPNSTILTSQNEIVVAGDVLRYHSILKEGWVTKYSAKGTVLWTRRYYTSAYNYVVFNNVVQTENETFLVTGNIGNVDTTTWPVTHLSQFAFVMKIDKYGGILWSKALNQVYTYTFNAFSDVQSTIVTKEGDCVLSMSYFNTNAYTDYRLITKIDKDGNIKWLTSLNSTVQNASTGNSKIAQIKNGNIIFVTNASQYNAKYSYQESGFYFASIDNNTGLKNWERFYVGIDSLAPTQRAFGEITGIAEFPNGDLSFITSYAVAFIRNFHSTTQVFNFVTDSIGNYPHLYGYTNGTVPFYASSAVQTSPDGSRLILMDNADVPFLMEIQPDGNIKWQKSYGALGRSQQTKSVLTSNYGNYFLSFTQDGGSKTLKLVKTDLLGNIPCIQNTSSITMQDLTYTYYNHTLKLVYTPLGGTWNTFTWISTNDYTLSEDFKCRKACCTDVTDTAAKANLCDKPYYILPNADTIKSSGTYSVVLKASTGCDSIVYYPVDFAYTPSVSLGIDKCMGEKDTIMLSATQGYDTYYWNNISSPNFTYEVQQPGNYTVRVTNRCGSSIDSIMVYKQCEFEIKMPTAFTPNGDNKNDLFRVPPQIYNRLISFTVFNRWGQIMFRTSDVSKGWDGQFQNHPAPTGTYVYYVVMRSLDNRKNITGKGYVTLLR